MKISDEIKKETATDLFAIIITSKRYDDDFFYSYSEKYSENKAIISFFSWEKFTTLPLNNGVVYFIANLLAQVIDNSFNHGKGTTDPNPGCVYDFMWKKTSVDLGMRSAVICQKCMTRIRNKNIEKWKFEIFNDLKNILNDLGNASKWQTNIIDYWSQKLEINNNEGHPMRDQIFISYSHEDKEWLNKLKRHLKPFERTSLINVWEDTRIKTGQDWKKEIEHALNKSKIAVLLISADFLASDFIANNELPPLLDAQKSVGLIIMPVILKPCAFSRFNSISRFQSVNPPSNTLIEMDEGKQERFLLKIADDILNEMQ